ncbi:alpha/beta hydrolase [Streptosporangium sp. NPDC051022]|uniref:alpha/beta hydrolase n=1 Tax=Streptosporangium sp. NPDC051022 TaxID=3155752 RepID=UPI00341A78CF
MNSSISIPVVFIHGLWTHEGGWEKWMELFNAHGYQALAPGRPGDRRGITEITRHVAGIIRVLPGPPIVIGHCLGGLVAQKLLGLGLARGGVAIAPPQFRGIRLPSPTQIRTVWPLLDEDTDTIGFTREQFHERFANGLSREESDDLYGWYHIRWDTQPVLEIAGANMSRRSPAAVDTRGKRGPLLLIAGKEDRIVPPSLVKAAYGRYRDTRSITEYQAFEGRGHSLCVDHGWADVAEAALSFLDRQGLAAMPGARSSGRPETASGF